ncbi:MAG: glycosyl hydrolase [Melioribacteraceae bacterium]|nr:MAG: glycosyl hydrolase [Melioribacteraceae bacterium]
MLIVFVAVSCKLKEDDELNTGGDPVSPGGTTGSITINSPANGDSIVVASSFEIKWGSENVKQRVNIEYSTNNGSSWTQIVSNIENSGSYVWNPIPNVTSNQCRVKIVTADSTLTVLNGGVFSIVKSSTLSLELKKPNGGEVFIVSDSLEVEWSFSGIEMLRIEISKDNGSNWLLIETAAPAFAGRYVWKPDEDFVSDNCLVKVSDVSPNGLFDISNSKFSILIPQFVKITSPNGGEYWQSGTSQEITWLSSEVENVKIEYTINNGLTWLLLTSNTPSDGYFMWTGLPSTPTTMARIRISDADDGFPSDLSDEVFTIIPEESFSVTAPNGGEVISAGTSFTITWDVPQNGVSSKFSKRKGGRKVHAINMPSNFDGIESMNIDYSENGGADWVRIVSGTTNDGEYIWNNIPDINSNLCLIKISDAEDSLPMDISDKVFTISSNIPQFITVTTPNGGENWESGTTETITWLSGGVSNVRILYTTNNGINWNVITENTESDGFYSWEQVPVTASTNCKIRIENVDDTLPADESDSQFSIVPETEIMVTFPDGKEVLQSGVPYDIRWTSTSVENVKIEFTSNSGAVWTVVEQSVPSTGVYNWTTVPSINSSQCRVRISDAVDGLPYDISNENFQVRNQVEQSITLNSPNGGEEWQAGTNHNITWDASAISTVSIEYSTNNGINWETLAEDVINTGSYAWHPIPDVNSTQCKIKIFDATDNTPVDESDGLFTIKPVPSLEITSPNGGELYVAGQPVNIIWNSTGVENVKIEYTINNGISPEDWFILVANTPSDGLYETGFSIPSEKYRIRITEAVSGSPRDESNGTFTISPQPGITVESPNGGEDWLTGTTVEIRWNATNIENVDIEYTIDGGAEWKPVADNVPSNGLHNWTIPASIDFRSDLCLIRVLDASDGSPSDQSDNFFTIHPEDKLLRWTFPNGGEYVYREPNRNDTLITWISAGIDFVDIEYTSDNGQTWLPIVNNYHSTGAYLWTIPLGQPSTLARIRIFDSSNHDTTDMSDSHFYLHIMPAINVEIPQSGYIAGGGDGSCLIKWTADKEVKSVIPQYSFDDGNTWRSMSVMLSNNGGVNELEMRPPFVSGESYLVRLKSGELTSDEVKVKLR